MSNCGGGGSGSNVGGISSVSAGDWICPDIDCRHLNFARRLQCNKCDRERENSNNDKQDRDRDRERGNGSSGSSSSSKKKLGTEIGKVAADKSRGLFSAEDWQCSKCANVNWARRQTCNMCNAPKFTDVEERTGFGGGYNDRGVVEYKEREESDSEYDEFGRRKKRKNNDKGCSGGGSERSDDEGRGRDDAKRARRTYIEGDDEEDDEDDDDEDLSKYDLWGDNEVSSSNEKSKETDNSIKQKPLTAASAISERVSRDSTSSNSSSSSSSSSVAKAPLSTSSLSSSRGSNGSSSKREKKRFDARSRSPGRR